MKWRIEQQGNDGPWRVYEVGGVEVHWASSPESAVRLMRALSTEEQS